MFSQHLRYNSDLGVVYNGEFDDGVPSGPGTFTYKNGDTEEVIMENGVRHGRYAFRGGMEGSMVPEFN